MIYEYVSPEIRFTGNTAKQFGQDQRFLSTSTKSCNELLPLWAYNIWWEDNASWRLFINWSHRIAWRKPVQTNALHLSIWKLFLSIFISVYRILPASSGQSCLKFSFAFDHMDKLAIGIYLSFYIHFCLLLHNIDHFRKFANFDIEVIGT